MAWFEPIVPKKKKVIKTSTLRPHLEMRMSAFTADLQRELADYSDAPPSPNYLRTNTLKRSWDRKAFFWQGNNLFGLVWSSGQIAPYNKWVRGKKGQQAARMAARGWRSITEILNSMWPPVYADFKRIIKNATK